MATSVASTSLWPIVMPNLLRRENCDTEVGKQLLLVGCENSIKIFDDHISFAYTHFSLHIQNLVQLLLLANH